MLWCACIVLYTTTGVLFINDDINKLSFPGGKIEKTDKGVHETAVREFCEEVFGLAKNTPRYEIFKQCPSEIIQAFASKQYESVVLKGSLCYSPVSTNSTDSNQNQNNARSNNYKHLRKDTIYYCIKISERLAAVLRNKGMLECPISKLLDVKMRKRETKQIKEQILNVIS
jgi:hypothetical protein